MHLLPDLAITFIGIYAKTIPPQMMAIQRRLNKWYTIQWRTIQAFKK